MLTYSFGPVALRLPDLSNIDFRPKMQRLKYKAQVGNKLQPTMRPWLQHWAEEVKGFASSLTFILITGTTEKQLSLCVLGR